MRERIKFLLSVLNGLLAINTVLAQSISPSSLTLDPLSTNIQLTINNPQPGSYLQPGLPTWLVPAGAQPCNVNNLSGTCTLNLKIDPSQVSGSSLSYSPTLCMDNFGVPTCTPALATITVINSLPVLISPNTSQQLNSASTTTTPVTLTYDPQNTYDPTPLALSLQQPLPSWLSLDTTNSTCTDPISIESQKSCSLVFKVSNATSAQSYQLNYCYNNICTATPVTFNFSPTYIISGKVSGLTEGNQVILEATGANDSQNVTITQNGDFTFPKSVSPGTSYAFSINNQPTNQTCSVNPASEIVNQDINNLEVDCTTSDFTLSGSVTGIESTDSVTLQLQQTQENLTVTGSSHFSFTKPLAKGSAYDVSVTSQPSGMTCSVTNGSGTNIQQNITNMLVTCSKSQQTIGGTLTGLASGKQVTLTLNNSTNTKVLTQNGNFTFPNPIAYGSTYNVSVQTQPTAQNCTVTNGTGTANGNITNVAINCVDNASLQATPSNLALSVTGRTEYGIPQTGTPLTSGLPRTITIKNTGGSTATNLQIVVMPSPSNPFPAGTDITANTCGNGLGVNQSCSITITPGGRSSNDSNSTPCSTGTIPLPSNIQVTWEGANPILIPVTVLDYGCNFQGGYIFALDDSPVAGASIQGKVVGLSDQSTSSTWKPENYSFCGISVTSFIKKPDPSGQCKPISSDGCDGKINGSCNSSKIMQNANSSTASLCTAATINGYSDWYLPAICELSYSQSGFEGACGLLTSPLLQNIYSNLFNVKGLTWSASYWSSTEASQDTAPATHSWYVDFPGNKQANPFMYYQPRTNIKAVRCVRQFKVSP